MSMTKEQIRTRREEIASEILELAAEEDRINSLTPEQEMAEELHRVWCRHNHTDGCGWMYEGDDWTGHAHRTWLNRTARIVLQFPNQTTAEIIKIGALFR